MWGLYCAIIGVVCGGPFPGAKPVNLSYQTKYYYCRPSYQAHTIFEACGVLVFLLESLMR